MGRRCLRGTSNRSELRGGRTRLGSGQRDLIMGNEVLTDLTAANPHRPRLQRRQRCLVVRLLGDLRNQLGAGHVAVCVDDDDRACE